MGVGKRGEQFNISPIRIILFALLVASLFLGGVSLLLLVTSLIVNS
jgi:hypothetical protein